MKKLLKNKKVWIGVAVVVAVFAWAIISGDTTPVDATTQG